MSYAGCSPGSSWRSIRGPAMLCEASRFFGSGQPLMVEGVCVYLCFPSLCCVGPCRHGVCGGAAGGGTLVEGAVDATPPGWVGGAPPPGCDHRLRGHCGAGCAPRFPGVGCVGRRLLAAPRQRRCHGDRRHSLELKPRLRGSVRCVCVCGVISGQQRFAMAPFCPAPFLSFDGGRKRLNYAAARAGGAWGLMCI